MIKIKAIVIVAFVLATAVVASANLAVVLTIPENYQVINPGDKLMYTVSIANRGATQREDVMLNFKVEDTKQEVIKEWDRTVAVQTQMSLIGEIVLPKETAMGSYKLNLDVRNFDNEHAYGSHSFRLVSLSTSKRDLVKYGLLVLVAIQALVLIYEHFRVSKLFVSQSRLKSMIRV